jgi:hypothetical protein
LCVAVQTAISIKREYRSNNTQETSNKVKQQGKMWCACLLGLVGRVGAWELGAGWLGRVAGMLGIFLKNQFYGILQMGFCEFCEFLDFWQFGSLAVCVLECLN